MKTMKFSQRGFTLVELMVAIVISVFLIGGLLMMVQSTRNAFGNQNLLGQLQDNERLAMTFMADVIESTGYFPDPVNNTNVSLMPAIGSFAPGQAVFGTFSAAAPGDTVSIRYAAAAGDQNLFNCLGKVNTAAATDVFTNTFSVDPVNQQLVCTASSQLGSFATTTVPLVNGVQKLVILYGVKRSVTDTGSCADTYLSAAPGQMLAADWNNVCSVSVEVTFTNPIPPQNPPTIIIRRVIATMNAAGVNS